MHYIIGGSGSSAAKSVSAPPLQSKQGTEARMLFTDYMVVGGRVCARAHGRLRYSRAPPATGSLVTRQTLQCFHRSVGEPAEGSLNQSTTHTANQLYAPSARPPPGTARVLENTRSAHGSAGGGPAGLPSRALFPSGKEPGVCGRPPPVQLTQPKQHNQTEAKAGLPERAPRHKQNTTLNNGYLGSRIDEERSEMRYVV